MPEPCTVAIMSTGVGIAGAGLVSRIYSWFVEKYESWRYAKVIYGRDDCQSKFAALALWFSENYKLQHDYLNLTFTMNGQSLNLKLPLAGKCYEVKKNVWIKTLSRDGLRVDGLSLIYGRKLDSINHFCRIKKQVSNYSKKLSTIIQTRLEMKAKKHNQNTNDRLIVPTK